MPAAVSFIVKTYSKLARGETGVTQVASRRLCAGDAITWILDSFPEEAVQIVYLAADGSEPPEELFVSERVRLDIDWTKVPESIRNPQLPARRR